MRFPRFARRRRAELTFAEDTQMQRRGAKAALFFERVLLPDEEPGFVSDEATLRDISLAPDEELIRKIQDHYGKQIEYRDFTKPFWRLLDELDPTTSCTTSTQE